MANLKILVFLFFFVFINAQKLTVVTTKCWEPFNMVENGKLEGIGVDFWKIVAKQAKIDYSFKIVDKWCDVLDAIKKSKAALTVSAGITPERKKYAVFSKPYVEYPLVIATKNDVGFIFDLNYLKNKKIAIGNNYTAAKLMLKHYPDMNYVFVHSVNDALKMVNDGEVFAAVDILPVISYKINKYEYGNLKIAGQIPVLFKVRFMLSKKYAYLLPEINKYIDSISYAEKEKIYKKYINTKKTVVFNASDIFLFFLISGILLIIVFLWIYSLKQELRILKDKKLDSCKKVYDKLTGIYNKDSLLEYLKTQIDKNNEFSVIVFDIKEFKNINRFYGHQFGDITLLELVSVVKSNLKKDEFFARIGGGTFAIVLNETEKKACKRAKEVYNSIKTFNFSIVKEVKCTFVIKTFYNTDTDEVLRVLQNELLKSKKNNRLFRC